VYVAAVVLVAILTVLVWRSGSRLQDAIRQDATRQDTEDGKTASTIAQLTVEAEKARAALAKAHAEAAAATLRAEEERQRRLKLELVLAPRTIAAPRRARSELKQFAGTKALITYVEDSEARDLAQQVYTMLVAASWNVLRMVAHDPSGAAAQGVQVCTRGADDLDRAVDDAAEILYFQLRDDNIDASIHTGWTAGSQRLPIAFPDDAVLVHVAPKPSSPVVAQLHPEPLTQAARPSDEEKPHEREHPRAARYERERLQ
jgi:hypothetical protein